MSSKYWAILTICMILPFVAFGDGEEDEPNKKVAPSIEAGIALGGLYSNHSFTNKPLKTMHLVANIPFTDQVFYGIGTGFEKGPDIHVLPFYLMFKGMFDDQGNTPYITSRVGYAVSWSDKNKYVKEYEISGGMLFAAGAGYRYRLGNTTSFLIEVGYHHQFLVERVNDYETDLNLDMISLKAGVLF